MSVPKYIASIGIFYMILSHVNAQECIFANRCDCRKFTCRVVSSDRPQSGLTGPRLSFLGAQYQHGGKCDDGAYPGPVLPGGRMELNVGNEPGVLFVGKLHFLFRCISSGRRRAIIRNDHVQVCGQQVSSMHCFPTMV